jgi:hypothetical protein
LNDILCSGVTRRLHSLALIPRYGSRRRDDARPGQMSQIHRHILLNGGTHPTMLADGRGHRKHEQRRLFRSL